MNKPRKQCKKCPWKKSTKPHEIPNGYSVLLHQGLENTITREASFANIGDPLRVFACHEMLKTPCVGWLVNQLGVGNNIPLRLRVHSGKIDGNVEVVGPQHETFEDTLP